MWMPTHVQLTVQRAKGLLTKGKHGTNDCFVVMSLGKEKYQTSVKEKAPPEVDWCEQCELTIPKQGNTAEIKLTVLHRNFLGVDEFLGQTSIPLGDHDVYELPRNRWYQLHSKPDKKDTKRRGELEVRLAFTVKPASVTDLSEDKKTRGSLRSLPKVAGTLGGSLASLGHNKKSLRKLAASVGHKVAKVGGRRRGSSSRGTSEAGSDVGSDLGWDDGASSNADPGVISEGEEDMFGLDDDQGRRTSVRTPELHSRLQPKAVVDETPLSSLSSSVQSGLDDLAHAATSESPVETTVRPDSASAISPLVTANVAEDVPFRSAWPGSTRFSGRLKPGEPPSGAEDRAPAAGGGTDRSRSPADAHTSTDAAGGYTLPSAVDDRAPLAKGYPALSDGPRVTLSPVQPSDTEAAESTRETINTTEPPVEEDGPEHLKEGQTRRDKLGSVFRSQISLEKGEQAVKVATAKEQKVSRLQPSARTNWEETAAETLLTPQQSTESGAAGAPHQLDRLVGGRLSGRLRPYEPPGSTDGRSANPDPPHDAKSRDEPLQQSDNHPAEQINSNPFDEPEKCSDEVSNEVQRNPFEEPENNSFRKSKNPIPNLQSNPFEESETNPFSEPERNPFIQSDNNVQDQTDSNSLRDAPINPFDEPDYDTAQQEFSANVEGGKPTAKEKLRKRDKLGKMFRTLTTKKDEAFMDLSGRKEKELIEEADGGDSRGHPGAAEEVSGSHEPSGPTLRPVQSWAGTSQSRPGPPGGTDSNTPKEDDQLTAEEAAALPSKDQPIRDGNVKERFRKRGKPEKSSSAAKKAHQFLAKSAVAKDGPAGPLEKARRQTAMPRSDSVPLLRTSVDTDWPRVVEGGNERLADADRESRRPLDQCSRERLVEMVTELQRELQQANDELKKSRAQTVDMEEYLDCLLLRIMETSPQLLASPERPETTAVTKYVPR